MTESQLAALRAYLAQWAEGGQLPPITFHASGQITLRLAWPAPPAPDETPIATPAELAAMFAAGVDASGGKVYRLAPGPFGSLAVRDLDFRSNPIAVLGSPETWFEHVDLTSLAGVAFGSFNVDGPNTALVLNWCDSLSFDRVAARCSARLGNGWYIDGCSNITIAGAGLADLADVRNVGNVACVIDSNHVTFRGFTLTNWGPDGILFAGASDCLVDGALAYDATYLEGEHPDAIQGFISSRTGAICERIKIQNSGFLREAGTASQGFFFEWADGITFQDNYTFGTLLNALGISGGTGHLIDNNYCYGWPDYGSRVSVGDGAVDALVTGNWAGAFNGSTAGAGYVERGNSPDCGGPADDYSGLDQYLADNPKVRRRPGPRVIPDTVGWQPSPKPPRESPVERNVRLARRLLELWDSAGIGHIGPRPGAPEGA